MSTNETTKQPPVGQSELTDGLVPLVECGWRDVQPLYALTPEDVAAVNKSRKAAAWKAARQLDLCQCDHTEYCRHCFPLEFRPGGVWGGTNA